MKFGIVPVLAIAVLGLFTFTATAEDGLKLTVADKEPPAELAADIKSQLAPKCYTISDGKGTVYEFWFVPGVKAKKMGANTKETLMSIDEIALLGAAIVSDSEPHDFRDDPVDKGLYTMRMAIQPKDGNHMGTAPFDSFAILIPHERDADLKNGLNHDHMVELAQEGTIAKHPPILSLQPIEKADGEFPRMEVNSEKEWEFLYLKLPLDAGGTKGDLTVGLVVQGKGEL